MKIITLLGTRPEIIRLSRIISKLDTVCDHILVHTGQNYDSALNDIFFQQLAVRTPDHYLGVRADSFGEQVSKILFLSEKVFLEEKPDRLLLLGDTNSALSSFIAKRMGIPVFHMEAGNRCYDDRVPEEVNRRIIDHSSDIWMPYTERSRQNLIREGIPPNKVYVIGNPIFEVLNSYEAEISTSKILENLGLAPNDYFLVTMHRAENVDNESRLKGLVYAIDNIQKAYNLPIVVSTHPRTRSHMQSYDISSNNRDVMYLDPFGFFDFITLEKNARCILTDSGTVQEECAIFGVPNVTIRDTTERPETIECGSNMISGITPEDIYRSVNTVFTASNNEWEAPTEYKVKNVSDTVIKILLSHQNGC